MLMSSAALTLSDSSSTGGYPRGPARGAKGGPRDRTQQEVALYFAESFRRDSMCTNVARPGRTHHQPLRCARLRRALPLLVIGMLGACIQPSAGTATTIVDGMRVTRGAFVVRL